MTDTLHHTPAHKLATALARGEITSVQLTRAILAREEKTRALNAYLSKDADIALEQAAQSDKRRSCGLSLGSLDGIPIGLKDNIMTRHRPTTCGSKMLEGYVSPYDATVAARLHQSGAVLLGKLNMDEFAMGSSTEHSAYGPTLNPWDTSRVPGGSSGGSAAAVAAGSAVAALGTDTGGSIRQPASLCGIVGLKPTYGRVSRSGVIAYASSLDQVGPLTQDVTDCALIYDAIHGQDARDQTSSATPAESCSARLHEPLSSLRVGVLELPAQGVCPEVRKAVEAAAAYYQKAGATLVPITLPYTDHAIATYYVLAPAEASSNLARFDGVRFGARAKDAAGLAEMFERTRADHFGPEVLRRVMLGTYVLSSGYYEAYYLRAQKVRQLVVDDFARAFAQVDVILSPTAPSAAFKLGERQTRPLDMYLADVFTVSANLAGLPAISLPCGFTKNNLPIGMQLIAPAWEEASLLRAAYAYEQAHAWHEKKAPQ